MERNDSRGTVKALKDDIAASAGNGWPHPRIEQFPDLRDNLCILLGIAGLVFLLNVGPTFDQRQSARKMFHNRAKDRWFKMLPVASGFGDRNKIRTEENARDFGNCEQSGGERRTFRGIAIRKVRHGWRTF